MPTAPITLPTSRKWSSCTSYLLSRYLPAAIASVTRLVHSRSCSGHTDQNSVAVTVVPLIAIVASTNFKSQLSVYSNGNGFKQVRALEESFQQV